MYLHLYILHLCCGNIPVKLCILSDFYQKLHKVTVHNKTHGKKLSYHNYANFCFSAIGAGEAIDLVPHFHGHYIPDTSIVCGKKHVVCQIITV